MKEGREGRETAGPIFRKDRTLGITMEPLEVVQAFEVRGGARLEAAHRRVPVLVANRPLKPKRLHAAG